MNEPAIQHAPPKQRVIRVFISSTFRDMQAEREELVKRVFPRLRQLCEARGVIWGEVDLRWGVTDEQRADGQVLPICLAEIERCRPYFLGMLGKRYGWVPRQIPADLVAARPWLSEHRTHSVTALEILHGVLNAPEMASHAFFYFRDPAYDDGLPPEEADKAEKLRTLKERIRQSGLPVREDYPDPTTLGALVYEDLRGVIERQFPIEALDPLDRDAADHEAFARSRAQVYIGRQEYFDQLDVHAAGAGEPLVVLGESGAGKSALLANWALRYRERHPEDIVLWHFIGASPLSTDWAAMLRHILAEFRRRLDIEVEIPDQADALRLTFANALHRAAARIRVVLVLDALNQLEDREGALDLAWLPPMIPPNLRLVVSTLPGPPLVDLTRRCWPTLHVEPLVAEERRALIQEYLAQFAKEIGPERVDQIARTDQAANPLYLRVLLEELRVFGRHEQLDEQINHYLAAESIPALYERVLERWEEDYEQDWPGLVREAMTLVWTGRRGLSEVELLDLLGADGTPLPRAFWAPLLLAAERSLLSRSGLIGFGHDYLHAAVRDRYLPTMEARQAAHLRLAHYFGARGLGPRQVDELPWQYARAGDWDHLAELLVEPPLLEALWSTKPWELKSYWVEIEAHSSSTVVEAYRRTIEAPLANADHAGMVSLLLSDLGHLDYALSIRATLSAHFSETNDLPNLAGSLANQGVILSERGDLDGALALHREHERLCRQLCDPKGLQASLGNQGVILKDRGDIDGALALLEEQERLCRRLGDAAGLARGLNNQGLAHWRRGDLDKALALFREQERLCRQLGDPSGLSSSLGNQGLILMDRRDLHGALALFAEQERLCRQIGDNKGLATSLGNQASNFYFRSDLDRALALSQEQESLCRLLHSPAGLAWSLNMQALILQDRGDLDGALALYRESERLDRQLGDIAGLEVNLNNQALILKDRGDLDGALALHQEQERLCRQLGTPPDLSRSLSNQALIFMDRGDLDTALALCREAERISRQVGDPSGLSTSMHVQGLIQTAKGDLDGALMLYQEEERLCRQIGAPQPLQKSLGNQGLILYTQGDLEGAQERFMEQERLCRQIGNLAGLQASLGNQGAVLQARKDLDGALVLHRQQESLCRQLGDTESLATSLANQAVALADMNRLQEALPLAEEAYLLATNCGHTKLIEQIKPILDRASIAKS